MRYQCPNCHYDLEELIAPFREDAERDRARRIRAAAYKRQRYSTDPEYKERHKRRVRSTTSVAADPPATVHTFRLGE